MIGYVTVGTNNLDRAVAFYDAIFAGLGAQRFMEEPGRFVAWAVAPDQPGFSVTTPYDGNAASVGNGTMIALVADSIDKVQEIHASALQLGAADEGAPGPRVEGFYAAYFRDLDGNKLNVFCHTPVED